MVPIITFIGWHNTGKTTIVSQVVEHLRERGLRVAVIKSTKHTGIEFDRPGTDTHTYRKSGANAVSLMAPDQFIILSDRPDMNLTALVHRFFIDFDIVIGEGFKHDTKIPKIEISTGDAEPLRDQVKRVIATVTDRQLQGDNVFKIEDSREIADFIIKKYIDNEKRNGEIALLLVNGKKVPMKGFVQEALAGTVHGFVRTLKQTGEDIEEIDIKIRLRS